MKVAATETGRVASKIAVPLHKYRLQFYLNLMLAIFADLLLGL